MLNWVKRAFNTDKYNASSIRMLDNMGREGSTTPPFNYRVAVRSFRSWVYAAAWINASAVAATPLRLYVRQSDNQKALWRTRKVTAAKKRYLLGDSQGDVRPSASVINKVMELGEDMVEVTETHPVIDVLRKANHVYNGFDLTLLRTLYQELTGNAYLHPIIDPALGIPTQLWPMPSQWMQVIPSRDQFVDGYVYGADDVQAIRFEADEVVHFKRPNPDNLFYGLGKVEAAYGSIAANQAVHEMDLATFENHARPDYAVIVNGPHRRADLDVFEQHVSERLRGTRKSGQFLTVSGDVQFTPLNFPPKDLGGREEIVEEIAAVFGVPVSMMKANDPNLASARAGFSQWRESTILPLLRMDEDVLNQILLPMFGIEDDACLAYDNPVPADSAFDLQERQTSVAGGWMTLNEARAAQGLTENDNPLADELLINGQPLGAMPEPAMPGLDLPPLALSTENVTEYDNDPELMVNSIKSVLEDVATAKLSAHAAIGLCRKMGMDSTEATESVLSQVRIAMESRRIKAVGATDIDIYPTAEEAERRAEEIGCVGYHEHELEDGTTVYMPCGDMSDYTDATGLEHKAIADVELKPTATMAGLAERGLKLREEHGRGGTAVGVARARDISNRSNLSPSTVRRMQSFFARHKVDLQAPAAKPGHADYPSAGVIAWLLWGGDPSNPDGAGAAWANMKDRQLENASEKGFANRTAEDIDDLMVSAPRRARLIRALDFNGDGEIGVGDVRAFMERWIDGDVDADLNGDGEVDTADVDVFGQMMTEIGGVGPMQFTENDLTKLIDTIASNAVNEDKATFSYKVAMQFAGIASRSIGVSNGVPSKVRSAINALIAEEQPEDKTKSMPSVAAVWEVPESGG
jgi:HK97 family phage portal protein